jgi:ABC-type phosphate/phosphonate transport system substrate-binding protein
MRPNSGVRSTGLTALGLAALLGAALLVIRGPEYAGLLKQLYEIDGFVEARDQDYQPVRDAVELMGLGRPK